MANQVEDHLIEPLKAYLQKERLVTISTVDHLTGGPNVNAISWVYASDERHVLFAVDSRSKIVKNVEGNHHVVITMIANDSIYSISGKATIIQETLEEVPLKLSVAKLEINEVRDVMFYGSKISLEPVYEKTYDALAAAKLDNQVMAALKKG
ncbi:pyridoxamine 5'-phosphate oxidase family protein [Bacillus sp. PS06]|uniref:pyridoxamine 5'-phosphate oxidase family protein n=1 Tax=Bacillus sp. PS06 TaxID=2764176 RepID=UPI001781AABA|nr:pyridoxamine 5'-phosphate oxidase family protein [Bacillus sp. PS06]MBD8068439.1 pyridoxamine 5'-phosphate oxidase family protein [Bacillus sp. PS06]